MQHIRQVIKDTATPSWVSSVPANFGSANAGTLKADEWRYIITVYLPLALVMLWGEGSPGSFSENQPTLSRLLDSTMALVCAMTIASKRTMTPRRAAAYRRHLAKYVEEYQELYPHRRWTTSHHMVFHIYDFLLLFGPVHSWWCFPFERLIGQLQCFPHNHKFGMYALQYEACIQLKCHAGQLESTLLQAYICGGKLRSWLSRPDCPNVVKECKRLFEKSYSTTDEDSTTDTTHFAQEELSQKVVPTDLRHLVPGARTVHLRARVRSGGVVYATSSAHLGNSLIMFYPRGDRSPAPIPGSIKYIYERDGKLRVAVNRQQPAERGVVDPFRHYPDFHAQVFSSDMSSTLEEVDIEWVAAHYTRLSLSATAVAVLALTRVSGGRDPTFENIVTHQLSFTQD